MIYQNILITNLEDGVTTFMMTLDLEEPEFPEDVSREHYTFCRCGASNNKPFCEDSHNSINFKDEKN